MVSASGCGPEGRGFESHISPQKIQLLRVGFFHLCRKAQHHLRDTRNIISSEARTSLPPAAQMNEVEALPQMMLQQVANDVMLRINDVALRANGIVASRFDFQFVVDFQPKV